MKRLDHLGIFPVPACLHTESLFCKKNFFTGGFDDDYEEYGLPSTLEVLQPSLLNIFRSEGDGDMRYKEAYEKFRLPVDKLIIPENRIVDILFDKNDQYQKIKDVLGVTRYRINFLSMNNKGGKVMISISYNINRDDNLSSDEISTLPGDIMRVMYPTLDSYIEFLKTARIDDEDYEEGLCVHISEYDFFMSGATFFTSFNEVFVVGST